MPMSDAFKQRLFKALPEIAEHYGTPFHIYDEAGIRETGEHLKQVFSGIDGFREYFAVKALPNKQILKLMKEMNFGYDCSSIPELIMSRELGADTEDIMFTSNNTSPEEFAFAEQDGGCILNLDDISLIDKVPNFPELICFRYNPGPRRTGNIIIGNPVEAKYGITHEQVVDAYRKAKERGATRFGLHTMVASNELDYTYMVETARMVLSLAELVKAELDIEFEFVNIGGGFGIPYNPDQAPLDIDTMAKEVTELFDAFKTKNGFVPRMYMESGRFMTGPHGCLVTRAINHKDTYRNYIGVDSCMSALMRPALYEAYHHIDVVGKDNAPKEMTYDVVGSLCENNDKFAVQRELPKIDEGDLLVIHDSGAHGHAMGFQYNGRLRPQELLLRCDGSVELIRRAETVDDYFATQNYTPDSFTPGA
ncbi:diaminopimelate decarboxylase [Desulfuromonas acetoxidans]|uniref:Orn/DAP/Arg decarboxylase 2 n=1 Tax=Desulfuromonas acetoxidans (strain DSM 684 / 11070) TaxID=281689 RepID=Q1K231_DESA6|nr:diaminopimelate decarboxylase [Desulfuromonas acetoxidans]EAT16608.1 Orn/DAP/Arg decarboxylase 2 [Desulfuromonas acetoxidans DSM 684]MBF0644427.1 diaminopimelate decarboxylase [Desulfuromonas acetoxidans]NVD24719.1 diaminopimelate decarboxylase [Desulfuromonas acetoxidans]NVE16764.1 diaminopimelate decarboxylase [Desulfuromonas acetoxidans]